MFKARRARVVGMRPGPKAECRAAVLARRRAVPADVRRTESELLREHLPDAVGDAATVCAYWPVGSEPGAPELLERLAELCNTVLLPVTAIGTDGEHQPLRWGDFRPGNLVEGPFGLREPAGQSRGPEAITEAEVILVPALAVDRRGVRLGRGGGFYDRSLSLCRPGTRLVAVVRDDEVLDELPEDPHDVPMTHALTPAGLITLGPSARGGMPDAG